MGAHTLSCAMQKQREMLGVSFYCFLFLALRHGVSLNWKLALWARSTDHPASRICLSLSRSADVTDKHDHAQLGSQIQVFMLAHLPLLYIKKNRMCLRCKTQHLIDVYGTIYGSQAN